MLSFSIELYVSYSSMVLAILKGGTKCFHIFKRGKQTFVPCLEARGGGVVSDP